jgi:hypothetical protein
MHIFFTPDVGDPMLLDTKAAFRALHERLRAFLQSSEEVAAFAADTDGNPAPYSQFLLGLRLKKRPGPAELTLSPDGWLVLEGSSAELEECCAKFLFDEENDHAHLYTKPVSLIIEADNIWGQDIAS